MSRQQDALTRRSLLAAAGALAVAGPALAQNFPTGPVKIVTSVGAGGSPDVLTRILADHLTRLWGQQVIVINQPGAGGAVAIRAVAATPPDGHTLYMSLATNYIALPELQPISRSTWCATSCRSASSAGIRWLSRRARNSASARCRN